MTYLVSSMDTCYYKNTDEKYVGGYYYTNIQD